VKNVLQTLLLACPMLVVLNSYPVSLSASEVMDIFLHVHFLIWILPMEVLAGCFPERLTSQLTLQSITETEHGYRPSKGKSRNFLSRTDEVIKT
jgi:hypothetical protein